MERFCCDDLCEQGRDCPVRNQAKNTNGGARSLASRPGCFKKGKRGRKNR